jgi:hypothetical protein
MIEPYVNPHLAVRSFVEKNLANGYVFCCTHPRISSMWPLSGITRHKTGKKGILSRLIERFELGQLKGEQAAFEHHIVIMVVPPFGGNTRAPSCGKVKPSASSQPSAACSTTDSVMPIQPYIAVLPGNSYYSTCCHRWRRRVTLLV